MSFCSIHLAYSWKVSFHASGHLLIWWTLSTILKDWSHALPPTSCTFWHFLIRKCLKNGIPWHKIDFFITSLMIQVIDWQIPNLPPSNLHESHPISSINFFTVQWYLLIIFPNIQPWLYFSNSEIYQNQPCKLISSFKLTTLLLLIWNFNTFYTNDCCL